MKTLVCLLFLGFLCRQGLAQSAGEEPSPVVSEVESVAKTMSNKPKFAPLLVPEFLSSGAWESRHNLVNRLDLKVTIPKANLALRAEVLDRRPATSFAVLSESFEEENENGKVITQPGFALYHLSTFSRLLYGVLDTYGLSTRVRNIWIRGAPYTESRTESSAELKIAPSSAAIPQLYACLDSNGFSLGPGKIRGFASFAVNNDSDNRVPAFDAGVGYEWGRGEFVLEGFYTERKLPERKSSTWFNEKPALPLRNTRLFAGSASFSVPVFALAADLAFSETFVFGKDYYGSLGLRFGNKPWRFSFALDAAGSRYVDSNGGNPGSGLRTAVRLERLGKKTGLFRLSALFRGPGPGQGFLNAIGKGDFTGTIQSFNRMSGELYYRFPVNSSQETSSSFGFTRFSFSLDRDTRDEKKVLDSGGAMAAFKLGPVNSISEGTISLFNRSKSTGIEETGYQFDSYKLSQYLSWTIRSSIARKLPPKNSTTTEDPEPSAGTREDQGTKTTSVKVEKSSGNGKKSSFTVQLTTRVSYEKKVNKEGIWGTSFSASFRTRKSRLAFKAATPNFPQKWEYTISWRLQF